jgi:hypothetical protein
MRYSPTFLTFGSGAWTRYWVKNKGRSAQHFSQVVVERLVVPTPSRSTASTIGKELSPGLPRRAIILLVLMNAGDWTEDRRFRD